MAKLDTSIYLKDWLLIKPYLRQTPTDFYYLKLSNSVKNVIEKSDNFKFFLEYLDLEDIKLLACILTSYFEDIVSETNIWSSFTRMHYKLNNTFLPFYNFGEYYEDEINLEDVCFLIWHNLNTIQNDKFILPYNKFILKIGEDIMEIFDDAWESAPSNQILKAFYQIDEKETDFYNARILIDAVLFRTYLFHTDSGLKLKHDETEILEKSKTNENVLVFLNENRDKTIHNFHTNLLALKGNEWVAEIIGKKHPLSSVYLNMSQKVTGYFLYKGQGEKDVFIEHIASGKKFLLTKKSFDHAKNLNEIDTILFMGIVKWKNEWWFSGILVQKEFNADLILDEKNSTNARMSMNFLDHQTKDMEEILSFQLKAFKEYNNGHQIAFLQSHKIEKFIHDYNEFYNKSLKVTYNERQAAKDRARKEGYFGNDKVEDNFYDREDSGLIFFNPKSGCEIVFGINSAFPLPNNPFFDKNKSSDCLIQLFAEESISKELAFFCMETCKQDLPFFEGEIGKIYSNNLDFLLRFFKKDNYHTKPSITFTGHDN